jgi:hypothetical protein
MSKLLGLLGERLRRQRGCSNDEKDYMVRQHRHRRDGSAIDAKPDADWLTTFSTAALIFVALPDMLAR